MNNRGCVFCSSREVVPKVKEQYEQFSRALVGGWFGMYYWCFPPQVLQGNEDSRARNWLEEKLQWNCPAPKVIWTVSMTCDILSPEICMLLRTWNVQRIAMPWNSWAPKLRATSYDHCILNRRFFDLKLPARILPSSVTLPLNNFLDLDTGQWLHWRCLSCLLLQWYCLADDFYRNGQKVRKLKSS